MFMFNMDNIELAGLLLLLTAEEFWTPFSSSIFSSLLKVLLSFCSSLLRVLSCESGVLMTQLDKEPIKISSNFYCFDWG